MVLNRFENIAETIGNTPIVRLKSFNEFKGKYYAKLETFNPGGSSKDRIGISILDDAEEKGLLQKNSVIVEATSGNTGLGLALVGITRGYKVILIMPDKMSPEKMNLVKAVGCKVIVCPTEVEPDDPRSYYSVAKKVAEETENSFYANQYFNDANPKAHYLTTGPEIWEQTEGKITHFIAGVGTGGTISGTAKYLKEKNPNVKILGVDPLGSILAHYHKTGTTEGIEAKGYKTEGVGEDIIPSNVNFDLIDDFVTVDDSQAMNWTRKTALDEGILGGPSSGMVIAGAMQYAKTIDNSETFVVMLLPDTGERYLNKVYSDAWMRSNGFLEEAKNIDEILNAKSANLPPLIALHISNTLRDALMKIQKFRIELILVQTDDGMKYLTNYDVYDHLLQGTSKDLKLSQFNLKEIQSIDRNASIDELKSKVINYNQVVVMDNTEYVGIITKEDVIENLNFNL